jgi:hypothetical protein
MIQVWLLLIVHALSDYVFQSDNMVKDKITRNIKAYIKHFLVMFILSVISMLFINGNIIYKVIIVLMLSISHCLVDFIISVFIEKKLKSSLLLFIIDQTIHFLILLLFVFYFLSTYNQASVCISGFIRSLTILIGSIKYPLNNTLNILKVSFFLIVILGGGNIVVKKILNDYSDLKPNDQKSNSRILSTGSIIGIIERLIIFLLVITNNITATTWILTAKSIIRFNEVKDNKNNYAEYFLIGTLTSSAFAILLSLLLKYIIS